MFSCGQKEPDPQPDPAPTYVTMADISAMMSTKTQEFSANVKDFIVTAVSDEYAQIEDATAGARVDISGDTFKVGQVITGKISGKAKLSSGALNISTLDISDAKLTTASELPCMTVKLKDIEADKAKYTYRRVKLENVTFVSALPNKKDMVGSISQKGRQIGISSRVDGIGIEEGKQGDVVVYASGSACYIYSKDDFNEHEITSAFAQKSEPGVYKVNDEDVSEYVISSQGGDQYVYYTSADSYFLRIQNYAAERIVKFSVPVSTYKNGQKISMKTSSLGDSRFTDGTVDTFLEKQSADKLWLLNYDTNTGYIIPITPKK